MEEGKKQGEKGLEEKGEGRRKGESVTEGIGGGERTVEGEMGGEEDFVGWEKVKKGRGRERVEGRRGKDDRGEKERIAGSLFLLF